MIALALAADSTMTMFIPGASGQPQRRDLPAGFGSVVPSGRLVAGRENGERWGLCQIATFRVLSEHPPKTPIL